MLTIYMFGNYKKLYGFNVDNVDKNKLKFTNFYRDIIDINKFDIVGYITDIKYDMMIANGHEDVDYYDILNEVNNMDLNDMIDFLGLDHLYGNYYMFGFTTTENMIGFKYPLIIFLHDYFVKLLNDNNLIRFYDKKGFLYNEIDMYKFIDELSSCSYLNDYVLIHSHNHNLYSEYFIDLLNLFGFNIKDLFIRYKDNLDIVCDILYMI